jgi:hypothetical protein
VSRGGMIDDVEVFITNLSFGGIGGIAKTPKDLDRFKAKVAMPSAGGDQDGGKAETAADIESATLVFPGFDGEPLTFSVTMRHIDNWTGNYGASFDDVSPEQCEALEQLMFPPRSV